MAEFYPVNDGDGYGDMYATPHLETLPNPDWVENNEDCDDSNEAINPETIGCTDQDRNGLGDPNDTKKGCFRPNSYILNNDDKCPFASGPLDNNGCPVDYENISYSDENYLFTRTYQKAMTTADGIEESGDVQESIVYYDGLGRPKQGVAIRQSPGMQDIVTHIGYDAFGRQDKEYLPFVPDPAPDSYGSFRSGDVAGSTQAYYQSKYPADFTGLTVSQVNAYAQKQLEASSAAMVTTYTYDPLVGVTSITDPRGVTMRYSYDDFNRLEFIRDETNSLLEQFRYHYKD
ncbi:DUF6443 domain-containing protein [Sinomicrobium oceani]|uniref:DUF6443 domain-containing protein n=1 Tax=Sinomicrobium oceani TaxID=1150368 RepID=UPI0015872781|nr:DUF6443 domain-containing protein [Sinomicrobium oceani]